MPTFINVSNSPITISEGITSRVVQIKETIQSDYPLDEFFELKRLSDTPYFNPIVSVIKNTSGVKEVPIDLVNTKKIKIIVQANQDIFINDAANLPGIYAVAGEILYLTPAKAITKLILNNAAVVIQMKDTYTICSN